MNERDVERTIARIVVWIVRFIVVVVTLPITVPCVVIGGFAWGLLAFIESFPRIVKWAWTGKWERQLPYSGY